MGRDCKNFASLHLLTHHNPTSPNVNVFWSWAHIIPQEGTGEITPATTSNCASADFSHLSLHSLCCRHGHSQPPAGEETRVQHWSTQLEAKQPPMVPKSSRKNPAPERACWLTWGAGGGWDGSGPLCARWDCFSSHSTACDQPAICWGQPAISNTQGLACTQHKHNNKLRKHNTITH